MNDEQVREQELAWIRGTLNGDQAAFTSLVDAYSGPVYNLCYRMLNNPIEAEDAAQETFIRAYTRLNTYDQKRKFVNWILSVASHYCIDQLRRRRASWISLEDMPYVQMEDHKDGPEDILMRTEAGRDVQRHLCVLPPDYRLVLVLRYWYQLSYKEISEATGDTESAIKSRLHRARLMLMQELQGGDSK